MFSCWLQRRSGILPHEMSAVRLAVAMRAYNFYTRIAREHGYTSSEALLATQTKLDETPVLESFQLCVGEALAHLSAARNELKRKVR